MKLTLNEAEVKQIILSHVNTMFATDFNEVTLDTSNYGYFKSATLETVAPATTETTDEAL